jgi:subtilase family serine protease
MIMINSRWIIALLIALVCMAVPAMAQPTPFAISGHVYDANDEPCNDASVHITNVNTSVSWDAESSLTSNYYQLVLDSDDESVGDVFSIEASGCSQSKIVEHTVTQGEIDGGGFSKDITLGGAGQPDLIVTEKSEEWISLEDRTYNVTYTVANTGTSDADASTTSIEIDETLVATDSVPALAIDESYTSTLGPFTLSGENDTIMVCADSDGTISELDETNNCLSNVLEESGLPDLSVTGINSYHNNTDCPAWFNLLNEIDVTVENTGNAPVGASSVSLYIEDVFFGKLPVPSMAAGASEIVTFTDWMPVGEDCLQEPCVFEWSYKDYNFTGVADCDNDVDESDEGNNETTVVGRACYNGYMADEPLENVAHGMLHGGLLFTTGDGTYGGLYSSGATRNTNFDITIPDNAIVELAKLNVYYTWTSPDHACPEMEVRITNATGTYVVPLEKAYDDIKCTCPGSGWIKSWGNYVFDLTDYITGTSTYMVTVENVGSSGHSFCVSAPGIALVYEDENAPLIEYWINEGADVLMGGRRYPTSSNLAWWENINNATFSASTETGEVVNATLGVVSPWGGSSWDPGMTNYLFFNDIKLGTGAYHGYGNTYSETIDGITMHVGSTNAQVGVNVTSVTDLYLKGSDNVVGQCDDGDNMMPCNAFFVVEYESSTQPDFIEIGDGTETEYYVPFHGNWDYGWSKIIYTKSEIGAPITITKIAFNVSKPAGYSYAVNDQSIYMGHTTDASFDGDVSKPDPSTLTEVYDGSITWESGWTIITLDTSFPYNNVDNLLIYYENRDGSYESNQPLWYRTLTLPDYRSVYNNADGSFPTGDGSQVRFIPNIQLHYSGVATGIAVSKTVYDPDAGEWVNSISGAIPGETYRFRIDVTATGCDLTDVVVNDTLSPGLGYAGNSSPSDPVVIGDVYQWTFPTLNDSETRTIEFDATVDYRGLDCNLAGATGWCNEPIPEEFSDEATACIDSRVDLAVKSDWNEHIKINPACNSLGFYRIVMNESNTIRVWIINNGPGNITSGEEFDVCFDLNGVEIACVTLQGPLNASEDRYYDIEWTPDCTPRPEWPGYPPMPGYPSTDLTGYTLNVTVDCPDCPSCPPGGAINETDEDNNRGYRAVYICNNGYKSKNIDCGPSDPLTSFGSSEMYGGVAYNVSGRKNYPFDPSETDTRIHNIEIPAGMTVVEARLYVYWYDYFYNPVPGCLANLGVNFNGTTFTMPDASYNDQKGLGTWNTPKGTYAYNVTSLVTGSGNYTVVVENIDQANSTTLLGEMLLVVYEDPAQDPNNRIQLWIMEGCDLLKSDAGYCVSTDEATATAAFGGSIDLANVDTASLISVVSQGMENGNNLLFNGNITRTDAWNASSEAGPISDEFIDGSRINVEVVDVTDNLTSSGNTLGFQDTGTMGFQASNAILVVEYDGGVSPRPDLIVTEKYETLDGSVFSVTYTVENNGNSNAGASTTSIYVDGTQVATDPVGALTVGATHEGIVVIDPFDCPCGTDVIVSVCADNEDVVDESDEANNCLNNTFSCPPCLRSDLVITEKSEEWIDQANKIYSITYTVANNGDAASGTSTTSITIDGTEVATDPVAGLAVSETHTATLGPFTMSGDDDTINVCADKDNVVDEIDETNNCLENTFAVEGTQSYGESVYSRKNVVFEWDALDEPDNAGAVLFRNAKIAIELEETVPVCNEVSVRVVRLGFRSVNFDVEVSSNGNNWNTIGSETINSWMTWEDYDFNGDFGDVKYIRITKPGTRWKPRLMGLDSVYAED